MVSRLSRAWFVCPGILLGMASDQVASAADPVELKKDKPANERQKRVLRWVLVFDTKDGEAYARQLNGLDAILGIPAGAGKYLVVRDLKKRPVEAKEEDLTKIQRIFWIDDGAESVKRLAKALQLKETPKHVVAFFPEKLEKDLLEKERKFDGRKEDEIQETRFKVVAKGKSFDVVVTEQKPKKE
jgi:hypothetical protein